MGRFRCGVIWGGLRLAVLAALLCWPGPAYDQERHTQVNHGHSEQTNQPESPTATLNPVAAPDVHKEEKPADTQRQPEQWPKGWFLRPEWVIAWITLIYVVFAGLQWRVIQRQACSLDRQIASSESTSQQQLRAYVHIRSAFVIFPRPAQPICQVFLENFGQTPAYNVTGWIHTWLETHPLKVRLPGPNADLIKARETLPPGRDYVFVADGKPPLAAWELKSLGTPETTLYIYGRVEYTDIFGKAHFTNFRLIYGGPDGPTLMKHPDGERWMISHDSEGNEAT